MGADTERRAERAQLYGRVAFGEEVLRQEGVPPEQGMFVSMHFDKRGTHGTNGTTVHVDPAGAREIAAGIAAHMDAKMAPAPVFVAQKPGLDASAG